MAVHPREALTLWLPRGKSGLQAESLLHRAGALRAQKTCWAHPLCAVLCERGGWNVSHYTPQSCHGICQWEACPSRDQSLEVPSGCSRQGLWPPASSGVPGTHLAVSLQWDPRWRSGRGWGLKCQPITFLHTVGHTPGPAESSQGQTPWAVGAPAGPPRPQKSELTLQGRSEHRARPGPHQGLVLGNLLPLLQSQISGSCRGLR